MTIIYSNFGDRDTQLLQLIWEGLNPDRIIEITHDTENYEDIVLTLYNNGDLIPLMFDDVKIAYPGNPLDDVDLSSIDGDLKQIIQDKQRERKTVPAYDYPGSCPHTGFYR